MLKVCIFIIIYLCTLFSRNYTPCETCGHVYSCESLKFSIILFTKLGEIIRRINRPIHRQHTGQMDACRPMSGADHGSRPINSHVSWVNINTDISSFAQWAATSLRHRCIIRVPQCGIRPKPNL